MLHPQGRGHAVTHYIPHPPCAIYYSVHTLSLTHTAMPFIFFTCLIPLVIFFSFLIVVNCSATTIFYALHHYICPLAFFFIISYPILPTTCVTLNSNPCFCPPFLPLWCHPTLLPSSEARFSQMFCQAC
ncbi:hypothetical protein WJX77_002014 [Trebouxia sp. C0004]